MLNRDVRGSHVNTGCPEVKRIPHLEGQTGITSPFLSFSVFMYYNVECAWLSYRCILGLCAKKKKKKRKRSLSLTGIFSELSILQPESRSNSFPDPIHTEESTGDH